MPKRKLTKTADSNEAQEGTWVTYREPTNAEMRDFRAKVLELNNRATEAESEYGANSDEVDAIIDEAEEYQAQFLASYIEDWNWVADEDGEIPMPKPKDNPDAFRDLLQGESVFLFRLFNVSVEKKLLSRKR